MNQYTIKTEQTHPDKRLMALVQKHINAPFLAPISAAQQQVFDELNQRIGSSQTPIILDWCCGTGMSTALLAKRYPDHWVIGIDQSIVRLDKTLNMSAKQKNLIQKDNALWLRADMWALIQWLHKEGINLNVQKQFCLYPNPWPKPKHLMRRLHGHPLFPKLIALCKTIEIRSNWRLYLEEFQLAINVLNLDISTKITALEINTQPLTRFETKYWQHHEPTYQFLAHSSSCPASTTVT